MLRKIDLLLFGVNKLIAGNKRVISSVILFSIFSTQIFAEEPLSYTQSGRSLVNKIVAFIKERPLESTVVGVVTLATGALAYTAFKVQAQQGHPHAGAAAAGIGFAVAGHLLNLGPQAPAPHHHGQVAHPNAPGNHPHDSVAHLSPEQMLALALERSALEARPFQELGMGAGEYRFNRDLFEVFRALPTVEEQVIYLQELLYNHDQVFMEHDVLLAFVLLVQGMETADIVAAFHKLTEGKWSLLRVVPQVEAIDPEESPGLNLRSMREDYRRVREMFAANADVMAAYQALLHRNRHTVEDAILRLMVRRLFIPQGLSPQDIERADFAMRNLFGDHAVVVSPEIPAAAQPLVPPQPAPRELTPEEVRQLREARLKALGKKA